MKLILLRHGQPARLSDAYQIDPPLTDLGHAQADYAAERLVLEEPDVVIASHLKRAVQTAEPTAMRLGLKIRQLKEIAEVDGDANDGGYIHIEDIRAQGQDAWAEFLKNPIKAMGGNEARFKARVLKGFQTILDDYAEAETVAVFSHGFPINVLLSHILGLSSISRFIPAHGSITRLRGRTLDRMTIVSVNETGHFPVEDISATRPSKRVAL